MPIGKLVCLMGKSASGKDTVYKNILTRGENLDKVVLHTTRPQRSGEKDGREYFFVTDDEMDEMERNDSLAERRNYDTCYGKWSYAVAESQIKGDRTFLLIETYAGYKALLERYGKDRVLGIYLMVDDGERLSRALGRERQQDNPKYDEMCRRYLADETDFAGICEDENVVKVKNDNIDACVDRILEIL